MRSKISAQVRGQAPPPSGEIRAFIYQQLSEIQSLLPEGSAVQVSVSAVEPQNEGSQGENIKPKHRVTSSSKKRRVRKGRSPALTQAEIHVESMGGQMVSMAQSKDEYWAILEARAKMEKQIKILEDTQFYAGEEAREDLVDAITAKQYLH